MRKLNCWEMMNCGREPNGYKVENLGICPAAVDESSNGINSGKNAGRICWAVAGTFCKGKIHGEFALEVVSCMICDVYERIRSEEDSETFHLLRSVQSFSKSHK